MAITPNNDLTDHIRKFNEDGKRRMQEDPNLWVGMITEDPEHWREYGITTPEQFNQYLDDCFEKEVRSGNIVTEDDAIAVFDPDNPYPEEDH